MVSKKVVIFAIDGASWNILDTLMQKGLMPNLNKFQKRYGRGRLTSSTPPATFPAWMNFLTGRDQSEHKIVGLINLGNKLGSMIPLSGADRLGTIFPEILDRKGINSCYVNLPGLFPLNLKHSKALSSFLWPGSPNYYPSKLIESIPEVLDYKLFPDFLATSFGLKDYVDEFIEIETKRFNLSKRLFESSNHRMFFHLVSAYDWIFHKIRGRSLENFLKNTKARKFFKLIDSQFAWFLERSTKNTRFILMSDHGEKRFDYKFYANLWLIKKGLLKLKHVWYKTESDLPIAIKIFNKQILESDSSLSSFVHFFKSYPILYSLVGFIVRRFYFIVPNIFIRAGIGQWGKEIDQSKSKAYIAGYYMKFKGTKNEMIKIINDLRGLVNNKTGQKVFSKVLLRDDIFSGKHIKNIPEVILEWDSCVCDAALWAPSIFYNEVSYDHQKEGIFVSNKNRVKDIDISEVKKLILNEYGI